jgi:hypothetical protein
MTDVRLEESFERSGSRKNHHHEELLQNCAQALQLVGKRFDRELITHT